MKSSKKAAISARITKENYDKLQAYVPPNGNISSTLNEILNALPMHPGASCRTDLEKEDQRMVNDLQKLTSSTKEAIALFTTLKSRLYGVYARFSQNNNSSEILERDIASVNKLRQELQLICEFSKRYCTFITKVNDDELHALFQIACTIQAMKDASELRLLRSGASKASEAEYARLATGLGGVLVLLKNIGIDIANEDSALMCKARAMRPL